MFAKNYKSIIARIILALVLSIGVMNVVPSKASGLILYVKANANGANNGSSWVNAYKDLQSALSIASSGDEIWVATGIYKPTTGTDRDVSFALKNGVAIYGGFGGTETLLTQRNPATKVTILSGDIGVTGDAGDNSFHVVTGTNVDNTTVLDGFTIKLGTAQPWYNGGGMINTNSSPTLSNLIFNQNSASQGGGMFNTTSSNPNLTNVAFNSNTAYGGGGMANISSNPNLQNVVFISNSATGSTPYGGGLSNQSSSPILTNVIFSSNSAYYGGGISNYPNSSPILNNVTFSSNSATVGGGMYNFNNSSPNLTNVTFSGNTATSGGGGLGNNNSSPILTNVTFSGNSAPGNFGGGISNVNSSPKIRNSILYDYGTEIWNSGSSAPTLTYSIVRGGYIGMGNLNVNPLLSALANNGGFTQTMAIGEDSPAIDAGSNTYCPATDQRGVTRPQRRRCDIGAYEHEFPLQPLYVNQNASGTNNGISWDNAYTDLQSALAIAYPGDEIWVAAGTYKPTTGANRTVSFVLKNGVAVYGGFAGTETLLTQRNPTVNNTILSGDIGTVGETADNSYHVVIGSQTDNTAVLDGFTVTSGNTDGNPDPGSGGGMYIFEGSPKLTNLIFTANNGSGLSIDNCNSSITNVTFAENSSSVGGGMVIIAGQPTFNNVLFSENSATYVGGGLSISNSDPVLERVTFYGNTAQSGAGIYNYGNPTLKNVSFNGNTAVSFGGGIYNEASDPSLKDVAFTNNMAPLGGGIYNDAGSPTLTDVIFSGNSASDSGGGIYSFNPSTPKLERVTFINNSATNNGGGMSSSDGSSPILIRVIFDSNSASVGGGMLNHTDSNASLTDVTFKSNSASQKGGGIYNQSSNPVLTSTTLYANSSQSGAGIYNHLSNVNITNSTIVGNLASGNGGAIFNWGSNPVLRNVTISGNSASHGGAIYNDSNSHPDIANSILYGDSGEEIYDYFGSATVTYSIVQGGYTGDNNIDANPMLGLLQDNEGITQTMALLSGSPAIDAGDEANCPATDQGGVTRPQGEHCDIGAYEYVEIIPKHPVMKSQVLTSPSFISQFGTTSGSPSSLNQFDQFEADDDPAAYLSFQTPDGPYLGEQSFFLPQDAKTRLIPTMLLQVNFKGPAPSTQLWTWSIYDPTSHLWVKVGDSSGVEADQWQSLLFRIRQPWKYVSEENEIRIQVKSNNTNGDARIDYQALHVTYLSIPAASTPVTPPVTPRRPGTFSE